MILLTGINCKESKQKSVQTNMAIPNKKHKNQKYKSIDSESQFSMIATFPEIVDSTKFIKELINHFNLHVNFDIKNEVKGTINEYKKVKIKGSKESLIFLEYQYPEGAMTGFPWKYQILMSEKGKLIRVFSGLRYEFSQIMKNENPFLMILQVTAKGNGGHKLYIMKNGILENIYEGYYDYELSTYDRHQDLAVYNPYELKIIVEDKNKDGYNDLMFEGNLVYLMAKSPKGFWYDVDEINGKKIEYSIENPWKKIPIQFTFIYNKENGHFVAKENYHEKYELHVK